MINIVIELEGNNLNPVIDSYGLESRSLVVRDPGPALGSLRDYYGESVMQPRILLAVSRNSETRFFPLEEVCYIEAVGRMKRVVAKKESFEFYGTIVRMEEELGSLGFLRVHRGYLIWLQNVSSFRAREVVMADGKLIPVGRKYRPAYKEAMEKARKWNV